LSVVVVVVVVVAVVGGSSWLCRFKHIPAHQSSHHSTNQHATTTTKANRHSTYKILQRW
jgi:hypothetical protein